MAPSEGIHAQRVWTVLAARFADHEVVLNTTMAVSLKSHSRTSILNRFSPTSRRAKNLLYGSMGIKFVVDRLRWDCPEEAANETGFIVQSMIAS
jgi:hypothetical protein